MWSWDVHLLSGGRLFFPRHHLTIWSRDVYFLSKGRLFLQRRFLNMYSHEVYLLIEKRHLLSGGATSFSSVLESCMNSPSPPHHPSLPLKVATFGFWFQAKRNNLKRMQKYSIIQFHFQTILGLNVLFSHILWNESNEKFIKIR